MTTNGNSKDARSRMEENSAGKCGYGDKERWGNYWAHLGCWISPCYDPFSLGVRLDTNRLFLSFSFFFLGGKPQIFLHEIQKWKANWIGHILRRNCLLKQVIEGKIKGEMEVIRRRGRICKLLDDLNTFRPNGVYILRGLSSHQSGAL
jgi:hypothetical protein